MIVDDVGADGVDRVSLRQIEHRLVSDKTYGVRKVADRARTIKQHLFCKMAA